MNAIARCSIGALLLAATIVSPAQADSTSDLQSKVNGALLGAKSFVVTTQYPAQAYSATLVFVAPDRTRVTVAIAANTTDVVSIGKTTYSSKNGAPFEKAAVAPAESSGRTSPVGSMKVTATHPDVAAGGVTYGAFQTTVPLGSLVTLTCMYDKKNFRLVRCTNDEVTQTYKSYDDPANVVEAPANAIDAPKVEAPKDGK